MSFRSGELGSSRQSHTTRVPCHASPVRPALIPQRRKSRIDVRSCRPNLTSKPTLQTYLANLPSEPTFQTHLPNLPCNPTQEEQDLECLSQPQPQPQHLCSAIVKSPHHPPLTKEMSCASIVPVSTSEQNREKTHGEERGEGGRGRGKHTSSELDRFRK